MQGGMTIGELARRAGVGVPTVRYYERKGLLPSPRRRPSGYRHYQPEDERRLHFIRRAKELGFALEEIASLLKLRVSPGTDCAAVRGRAAGKLAEVEDRIAELERLRAALAKLVAACPASGPVERCTILDTLQELADPSVAGHRSPKPKGEPMKSVDLTIEGMHCGGCASTIEALLLRLPGIKSASVSHQEGKARILYDETLDDPERIARLIEQAGYRVGVAGAAAS